MAVAEFLENVDMAGLGLGDSGKVMRSVVANLYWRTVSLIFPIVRLI
jgi:hypothetical protein